MLQNKKDRKAFLIDIAIPNNHRIQHTWSEKMQKYADLGDEIKRIRDTVPLILSTTGIIPKALLQALKRIGLPKKLVGLCEHKLSSTSQHLVLN